MPKTIRNRLLDIFDQILGVSEQDLTAPGTTFESLGVDSLDWGELAFETEEEFDIALPDDNLQHITTFDEFATLVETLIDDLNDSNTTGDALHSNSEGKCFGCHTPILMHDGTVKSVEDTKIGDIVIGDNSTPRRVLNLFLIGY